MFALFIVVILVLLLFAILIFKKVLGSDMPADTSPDNVSYHENVGGEEPPVTDPAPATSVTVAKSAVNSGALVLVNSSKPYVSSDPETKNMSESRTVFGTGSNGKNIYSYYVVSTHDTACDKTALEAFNKFADGFYTATKNVDLFVSGAVAESGIHATGLALDLRFWTGGNNYYALGDPKYADDFDWICDNAYKYGFTVNSECEGNFCLRYVGVPHAYYIHKHDLSLEDYLKQVCKETLAFTTDGGDKYEVYYVHATGDMVSVPIYSADAEYEISGDNAEGLIVTVKMN